MKKSTSLSCNEYDSPTTTLMTTHKKNQHHKKTCLLYTYGPRDYITDALTDTR